ncbi:MgtC/SapB family protein [Paenibacillus elgii]|uniref:MgtC/SapB family protein n=1 Tax=Paenibacillus elgii TaxID=189691 RepID=UPI0013D1A847|nr:MgtC/SapB family protein [Paenibacillus elgii]
MELSLTPDVWHIGYAELTLRIVTALVLGGLIGLEREIGGHSAGFRTHILVCMGSALIVLLSSYGFSDFAVEANVRLDPARLAAQVISGIGFLGAGTIIRTGPTVSGLTTAASLWVVAAIGLAVGAGFYYGAVVSTAAVIVSLFLLNKVEKAALAKTKRKREVEVELWDGDGNLGAMLNRIKAAGASVTVLHLESRAKETEGGFRQALCVRMALKTTAGQYEHVVQELVVLPGMVKVETPGWKPCEHEDKAKTAGKTA